MRNWNLKPWVTIVEVGVDTEWASHSRMFAVHTKKNLKHFKECVAEKHSEVIVKQHPEWRRKLFSRYLISATISPNSQLHRFLICRCCRKYLFVRELHFNLFSSVIYLNESAHSISNARVRNNNLAKENFLLTRVTTKWLRL